MKKSELRQIIREEIQKLLSESYLKTNQLKPGMRVRHKDWDPRTSEPLTVVKVKGQIMLNDPDMGDTEPTAGGESDVGWIVEKWKLTEGLLDRVLGGLKRDADNVAKRRAVEKINTRVADKMAKIANATNDLEKMLNNELSDNELEELLKKLS